MLINEVEVDRRLNNPLNLMNRLRAGISPSKKNAMDLFVKSKEVEKERVEVSFSSSLAPISKDKISTPPVTNFSSESINDSDAKIKLAVAHDDALSLLTESIATLRDKVREKEVKASSIPSIISSASRVITDIRKERLEREKNNGGAEVHLHFFTPMQKVMSDYEVIEVAGTVVD